MSQSPGEKVVGTGASSQRAGLPSPDSIAAEIQAEIDDPLATTAEQLRSQGLARAEAQQKSQEKFGDARAFPRRCYWIKQGDVLMFRSAVIVLLSLVCLALGLA